MEKIYSVILLLSFFTGMLQPILPMVEYQLYQGSIIEFLDSPERVSEEPYSGVLSLTKNSSDAQEDSDRSLLDDDYYPLGIQNATIPKPVNFPHKRKLYLPLTKNVNGPAYLPNPPPPRLS